MDESDRGLIDEQIHYYRKRAPEYDATATPPDFFLEPQGKMLREALQRFRPEGDVLEIACGTGQWTVKLPPHARTVTALDSSLEMIEINRQRVRDAKVQYVVADVFAWTPDRAYDVVLFANWLSHVPATRFESFWELVAACLKVDGRVFFADEAEDAWRHEESLGEESVEGEDLPLVRRTLRDGSAHRVLKTFWNSEELESRIRSLGWDIAVHSTGAFLWGEGTRRRN